MPNGNGNKFKGSNNKKGRKKKNPIADFNAKLDEYGKIVTIQGGKHLSVQLADKKDNIVHAIIKGSHHRKIWYKKDELVIIRSLGNLYEVQGKVATNEIKKIQHIFDKLEGNDKETFIFDDNNNIDSDNSDKLNGDNNDNNSDFDFDTI